MINGLATGNFDYDGPVCEWKKGDARGQVYLEHAQLKALPFLDNLALIATLNGLSTVALDEAKSDITYHAGNFAFPNLSLSKNETISLHGNVNIAADGEVDGATQLGLTASVVEPMPSLKSLSTIFLR